MMFSMIVINDAGEEVDDETAIWWLHHNFSKKGIAWVCVGGKMSPEARLNRLKSLLPDLRYTYTLESFANISKNWKQPITSSCTLNTYYHVFINSISRTIIVV